MSMSETPIGVFQSASSNAIRPGGDEDGRLPFPPLQRMQIGHSGPHIERLEGPDCIVALLMTVACTGRCMPDASAQQHVT